ncbi:hypothetical protein BFJ63_vAg20231 [Fusarium oxysporum f. sp. narcissi]|uniref:Uncharacterized protein n=2 Tax=Fusarium oxysporum TaxID=5507 RepID=A0A4Q2USQ8_FUSOX|nr:hypothetical protein FOMG_18760 [Fusarium oxysporum f. sp. melonis 26406]RYC76894.1 hypothetical protein BFJ63_vAg20231 [Fusarium oxysporum f. sp. narcissi]
MATWTCAKSKIHPWTDVPATADPPHTFSWMVNFRAPVNHTCASRITNSIINSNQTPSCREKSAKPARVEQCNDDPRFFVKHDGMAPGGQFHGGPQTEESVGC